MKKLILLFTILIYSTCLAQEDNIYLKGGLANFDETDGFNLEVSYNKPINKFLDIELSLSYARTSDFPKDYKFSENLFNNYWYSKSSVLGITPQLNFVFIRSNKHYFSFYGGIGLMFIESFDNINTHVSQNSFIFQSRADARTSFSKSIGLKYLFYINKYGFGVDAKLLSPIKSKDSFFGQDNYRSLNFIIAKKF